MRQSNGSSPAYDVAIIGGGPGGTTTGSLLKKYNPALRVLILEKEKFPRDHIGESHLPAIGKVLHEMGVWDKVERAGFPVKIGATYTWGNTTDPWIFELVPNEMVPEPEEVQRPGPFEGWRTLSAFQVDRSIYDKVLLEHAASLGCEVREETPVAEVLHADDEIHGLKLRNGEIVTARHYVDASGNAAILRRSLNVPCDIPTKLMNVAFWDYWTKPSWAEARDAKATRIHVRSLPYGWVWFIRLSDTRISIGLVCPADYYKKCGKKPAELYHEALQSVPTISEEIQGATSRNKIEATTDWSFVVERTYGKNWFLVGECAGFADPILAAGLTLTHHGGRELAYTILELDRGNHERSWLLDRYHEVQTRRVRQHMRFAEFWYSANGIFEDVRANCIKIAEESGLRMTSTTAAFQWLARGGLSDDFIGIAGIGGQDLASMKHVMTRLTGQKQDWMIDGKNCFELNLANAKEGRMGVLQDGEIHSVRCWRRNNLELPEVGMQGIVVDLLRKTDDPQKLLATVRQSFMAQGATERELRMFEYHATQVLEGLANHYWVMCSTKKDRPVLRVSLDSENRYLHSDQGESALVRHAES